MLENISQQDQKENLSFLHTQRFCKEAKALGNSLIKGEKLYNYVHQGVCKWGYSG